MDEPTFRSVFPEFAEEAAYASPQIVFWIGIANARLNLIRFDTMADLAVSLYVAHNLTLARAAQKASAVGGIPGQNSGPLTAKSIGQVSGSYDTKASTLEGAGNYNLTTYGTRLWELIQLCGMGTIQLGGFSDDEDGGDPDDGLAIWG